MTLPEELLIKIFGYTDPEDLWTNCRWVSRHWRLIATSTYVSRFRSFPIGSKSVPFLSLSLDLTFSSTIVTYSDDDEDGTLFPTFNHSKMKDCGVSTVRRTSASNRNRIVPCPACEGQRLSVTLPLRYRGFLWEFNVFEFEKCPTKADDLSDKQYSNGDDILWAVTGVQVCSDCARGSSLMVSAILRGAEKPIRWYDRISKRVSLSLLRSETFLEIRGLQSLTLSMRMSKKRLIVSAPILVAHFNSYYEDRLLASHDVGFTVYDLPEEDCDENNMMLSDLEQQSRRKRRRHQSWNLCEQSSSDEDYNERAVASYLAYRLKRRGL
jgi:hypothetical protein